MFTLYILILSEKKNQPDGYIGLSIIFICYVSFFS